MQVQLVEGWDREGLQVFQIFGIVRLASTRSKYGMKIQTFLLVRDREGSQPYVTAREWGAI